MLGSGNYQWMGLREKNTGKPMLLDIFLPTSCGRFLCNDPFNSGKLCPGILKDHVLLVVWIWKGTLSVKVCSNTGKLH